MKTLQYTILEGLLDNDFDMDLTIGDVCTWDPDFSNNLRSPTEWKGYSWKFREFWAEHNHIKNAWTENKFTKRKSGVRLERSKQDARHGFSMALLCQPIDFKLDQANLNKFVHQFNKKWCNPELQLEVHVSREGYKLKFDMWNKELSDSIKSFMGRFYITNPSLAEGLLDADFDIKDEDISIAKSAKNIKNDIYDTPNKTAIKKANRLLKHYGHIDNPGSFLKSVDFTWLNAERKNDTNIWSLYQWILSKPLQWIIDCREGEFYVAFCREMIDSGTNNWIVSIKQNAIKPSYYDIRFAMRFGQSWINIASLLIDT